MPIHECKVYTLKVIHLPVLRDANDYTTRHVPYNRALNNEAGRWLVNGTYQMITVKRSTAECACSHAPASKYGSDRRRVFAYIFYTLALWAISCVHNTEAIGVRARVVLPFSITHSQTADAAASFVVAILLVMLLIPLMPLMLWGVPQFSGSCIKPVGGVRAWQRNAISGERRPMIAAC